MIHSTWKLLDLLDSNDLHPHLPKSSACTAKALLFKTKPISRIFDHVWDNDWGFTSLQRYPSPGTVNIQAQNLYNNLSLKFLDL